MSRSASSILMFHEALSLQLIAYGLTPSFLPLHTADYSDAWEVQYSPVGRTFERRDSNPLVIPSFS